MAVMKLCKMICRLGYMGNIINSLNKNQTSGCKGHHYSCSWMFTTLIRGFASKKFKTLTIELNVFQFLYAFFFKCKYLTYQLRKRCKSKNDAMMNITNNADWAFQNQIIHTQDTMTNWYKLQKCRHTQSIHVWSAYFEH